ncbi:hypothetical protein ID854_14705 [Xenorhabdus sp. M]|uniref:Uncharacterized protein n=1 Tax=Xenorhabdus szentirmaii TaxID=290112 RepID=A0AAW3YUI2_9GAMM|nr:hypothetical protein [Xenorhabdus sp. M]MBD2801660.1 hypothetical protein [Xenorhabdus sp. M]
MSWIDPWGLTANEMVSVRHHTSLEGLEGIKRDQAIEVARGNPIGVHVEVAPFGDPKTAKNEIGAFRGGSYVEFEVPKDTLVKTHIGPRNTAIIPTEQPLSLSNRNVVFKKESWWSRLTKSCK